MSYIKHKQMSQKLRGRSTFSTYVADTWESRDWQSITVEVSRLQLEIYSHARLGDSLLVHTLQAQLIESESAKLIAVKRVTQDNKGKATAGVDGISKLTPKERNLLVSKIHLNSSASPILRVLIPKAGSTTDKRPLGIPTIEDRAKQALAKLALEPEWEARFESHSFGFRPGRRCQDATCRIRHKLRYYPCWVYRADISGCFDQIDHTALLNKLGSIPTIQTQVEAWLKAGVFENGLPFPNPGRGTPQGGVISPLLANIALDGMQQKIWEEVYRTTGRKRSADKVTFVRYADDFVLLSPEKELLDTAKTVCKQHLLDMGLKLSLAKSRTLYTLPPRLPSIEFPGITVNPPGEYSFDFLGFTFTQRNVGRHKSAKIEKIKTTTVLPVVLPQQRKVDSHFKTVDMIFKKSANSLSLVLGLNPVIRGWRNYFRFSDAITYGSLPGKWDTRLYEKTARWIKRRYNRYGRDPSFWTTVKGDKWVFFAKVTKESGEKTVRMDKYSTASWSLQSYRTIDPKRSPYDGDLDYWCKHPGSQTSGIGSPKREYLYRKQKGTCPFCEEPLSASEYPFCEIDHIESRAKGGSERWGNQQLLHKECHSQKHNIGDEQNDE